MEAWANFVVRCMIRSEPVPEQRVPTFRFVSKRIQCESGPEFGVNGCGVWALESAFAVVVEGEHAHHEKGLSLCLAVPDNFSTPTAKEREKVWGSKTTPEAPTPQLRARLWGE
eukprot:2280022-Rhodomonas_salina.2